MVQPLLGPAPLPEDAGRGVLAADFSAAQVAGALSTGTRKQPALKLSQPPERGSGSPTFPGSNLG